MKTETPRKDFESTRLLFSLAIMIMAGCNMPKKDKHPQLAEVRPVKEAYFGVSVTDPYRYMENLADTGVQKWFKTQSDYARDLLDRIPGRKWLIDKMYAFDKRKTGDISSVNITESNRYFYLKTTPADQTPKLLYRDGFEGKETLIFDPEKYGSDTTQKYVISGFTPSIDGSKVVLNVSPNGSENGEVLIIDVNNNRLFPERISNCWVSGFSWLPDHRSFFYNRLQSGDVHDVNRELNSKVFLHMAGSDPKSDQEVFSNTMYPGLGIKPAEIPIVNYDKDSKYLYGFLASVDNRYNAFYAPLTSLKKGKISWKRLFSPDQDVYGFAADAGNLYVYTPKGAPNFKILKTPLANPDLAKAETIIPENPGKKLENFVLTKDGIFYVLSENGVKFSLNYLPSDQTKPKEVALPVEAGVAYLESRGCNFSDIWVTAAGWSHDYQRYRYLTDKGEFKPENLSARAEYPEYNDLVVEEITVPSHDGEQIPFSLIYKKGMKKNGSNPVLILGYGAYGISYNPYFSPNLLLWTEKGSILAVAHVRGGGEKGDSWYKGGYKTTKPNTWKDLISCAEFLVNEKYTAPGNISILGGSAGGILIGRAMTERPDLFAVAIPEVGCLNALRFENGPNGPINIPEFGTVKDSIECKALFEMDAYQHIKDGTKYPATLITAGMNDPRVIAWQPGKFAARLEAANASDKPVLFLVDYEAGHGIGNTKKKDFENLADIFSFALWQVGNKEFQPR